MKIIIAGAGEVGTHLAKLLSSENHDIVLIDQDRDRFKQGVTSFDIMTMVGSATSLNDLSEAGVKNCDLFIAVTPEESANITSCMLATFLGAKKTFARIDNYEYLLPKNKEVFQKLGVHAMFYPEMLAAKEIVSAIRHPWARLWFELCGGEMVLVGVKVRENGFIVNKYLHELNADSKKYHIVAIKRGSTTIIPNGSHQILANDLVFFAVTKEHVNEIPKITGKKMFEVKDLMIMGGSRIAIRTTQYLPDNIHIKLLEPFMDKCQKLAEKVPSNVTIFHDDGRNTDFLLQEGIEKMDAFVALTGSPEVNILACMAAKRFGVMRTVAEVENMDYIQMAEGFDIGAVINKKLIAASSIYRFLLDADVSTVKRLSFADAVVAEMVVREDARITKKQVKSLNLPGNITLGGLIRNGKAMMVDGETMIQANDHVVVFCLDDALKSAEKLFG
jgi:trk system potassium uptake protein TrkA